MSLQAHPVWEENVFRNVSKPVRRAVLLLVAGLALCVALAACEHGSSSGKRCVEKKRNGKCKRWAMVVLDPAHIHAVTLDRPVVM